MDLTQIQARIRGGAYIESRHARNERSNDNLTLQDVEAALLSGTVLEQYPDTGRGESCLVAGFSSATAIHAVCGLERPGEECGGVDYSLQARAAEVFGPVDTEQDMNMTRCNFCGGTRFTARRMDYLYRHDGKYLLVPNAPADVCDNCGMEFFPASAVKEIERHFFAIHANEEQPDEVLQVACKALA